MSLNEFVRRNAETIDAVIKANNPHHDHITDEDRRVWAVTEPDLFAQFVGQGGIFQG